MTARLNRWRRFLDQLPEPAYPLYAAGRSMLGLLIGPRHPVRGTDRVRPFFIIGSGRSGNTLMRRVLQAHSQLHIPPENHALGAAITIYRRNRGMPWPRLVDSVLGTFQFSHGFEAFEVELRPLAERLHDAPDAQRNLSHIIDSFYRFHAETRGEACVHWGDKTPLNTFNAFKIHAVFPEARFIHMVRDGVDVVESYVRAGLVETHEAAADRWVASLEAARQVQRSYPAQVVEIRYEELVRDPERSVRRVCELLGVAFEPGMLTTTEHTKGMGDVELHQHHEQAKLPIHTDSIGRGRRSLDRDVLQALSGMIGPQLRELGYDAAA